MSTKLVFANATDTHFGFNVVDSSNNKLMGQFGCDAHATASGTVSGVHDYKVLFTPGGNLYSPRFTGDTEITFVVFTQPVTDGSQPLTEEDGNQYE